MREGVYATKMENKTVCTREIAKDFALRSFVAELKYARPEKCAYLRVSPHRRNPEQNPSVRTLKLNG